METILQANPEDITAVYATFDGVGLQHKPLEKQIAKEKYIQRLLLILCLYFSMKQRLYSF